MQGEEKFLSLMDRQKSCLLVVDIQEKLIPYIKDYEKVINKSKWLINLANELNIPVIISEQYPKGLGSTLKELSQKNHSHYLEKVHFACSSDPAFDDLLADINKTQFILVGIETHVCVLQTALGLKNLNKQVFVVVDATGSRSETDYKFALKRMENKNIELVTSEMVFFEWIKVAGTQEFKRLSKLFLKDEA